MNFLFETHDLRFASPATISRMGMIFLSDEDVEVKRLVRKWLQGLPEQKHRLVMEGLSVRPSACPSVRLSPAG